MHSGKSVEALRPWSEVLENLRAEGMKALRQTPTHLSEHEWGCHYAYTWTRKTEAKGIGVGLRGVMGFTHRSWHKHKQSSMFPDTSNIQYICTHSTHTQLRT